MATTYTKVVLGFLTLLIATSIIYITFKNDVKFRVDKDKTTIYVKNENNRWIVAGRDSLRLMDGTSKMYRNKLGIILELAFRNETGLYIYKKGLLGYELINDSMYLEEYKQLNVNTTKQKRYTPYIRGPIIEETYFFDGKIDDVGQVPVYRNVEVINGSGFFLRYEVRDLEYDGERYKLSGETELSFGYNIKIELHPDYRWGWVYANGVVRAQYDIPSDYEVYNFRMFDPTDVTIDDTLYSATLEFGVCPPGVFINSTNGYVFYGDDTGTGDLVYKKTTDGGGTWGNAVQIDDSGIYTAPAIWYDRWTPNNETGNLIHIAALEPTGDDTHYFVLNTTDDSITEGALAIPSSSLGTADGGACIIRSTTNVLYATGPTASARAIAKSTDFGTSWTDITPDFLFDSNLEFEQLLPLSDGHVLLMYYDNSANNLVWSIFNHTSSDWEKNNTLLISGTFPNFLGSGGATVYDNDVYLTITETINEVTGTTIANYKFDGDTMSWSGCANLTKSAGYMYQSNIAVDENTGNLYLVVLNGTDAVTGLMDIYLFNSTDNCISWNGGWIDSKINEVSDDIRAVKTNLMSNEIIYAYWYNTDLIDLIGDTIANISIGILNIDWVTPTKNYNHTNLTYQEYSFSVTCTEGDTCGDVNVTLDRVVDPEIAQYNFSEHEITHLTAFECTQPLLSPFRCNNAPIDDSSDSGLDNSDNSYLVVGTGAPGCWLNVTACVNESKESVTKINFTTEIAVSPATEEGRFYLYNYTENTGYEDTGTFTTSTSDVIIHLVSTHISDFMHTSNCTNMLIHGDDDEFIVDYIKLEITFLQKGIITNDTTATPFFHNGSEINYECGVMNEDDDCTATFWVNATGIVNNTYTFFATASSDNVLINSINTSNLSVTIWDTQPEAPILAGIEVFNTIILERPIIFGTIIN